jgi:hypothetical protein
VFIVVELSEAFDFRVSPSGAVHFRQFALIRREGGGHVKTFSGRFELRFRMDRNRIGQPGFVFEWCRTERQGREEKESLWMRRNAVLKYGIKPAHSAPPANGRVDEIGAAR